MFLKKLFAVSVIVSSVFIPVSAIRCYQCSSLNDTECSDLTTIRPNLRTAFFKECENFQEYRNHTPFCRKTVFETLFPDKEKRTIRSCGWVKYHLPCYKADNDDHLETSCQCFEDGCNGSSQIYGMSAISLIVLGFLCFEF